MASIVRLREKQKAARREYAREPRPEYEYRDGKWQRIEPPAERP